MYFLHFIVREIVINLNFKHSRSCDIGATTPKLAELGAFSKFPQALVDGAGRCSLGVDFDLVWENLARGVKIVAC